MADGKGCKCNAYCEGECGCGADWTPQEVYDLREEIRLLKEEIAALKNQIVELQRGDDI